MFSTEPFLLDLPPTLAAQGMILCFGNLAWLEASQRRDEMIADGDARGIAGWTRICAAINALTSPLPYSPTFN